MLHSLHFIRKFQTPPHFPAPALCTSKPLFFSCLKVEILITDFYNTTQGYFEHRSCRGVDAMPIFDSSLLVMGAIFIQRNGRWQTMVGVKWGRHGSDLLVTLYNSSPLWELSGNKHVFDDIITHPTLLLLH